MLVENWRRHRSKRPCIRQTTDGLSTVSITARPRALLSVAGHVPWYRYASQGSIEILELGQRRDGRRALMQWSAAVMQCGAVFNLDYPDSILAVCAAHRIEARLALRCIA
jgi:hypothetical protein